MNFIKTLFFAVVDTAQVEGNVFQAEAERSELQYYKILSNPCIQMYSMSAPQVAGARNIYLDSDEDDNDGERVEGTEEDTFVYFLHLLVVLDSSFRFFKFLVFKT